MTTLSWVVYVGKVGQWQWQWQGQSAVRQLQSCIQIVGLHFPKLIFMFSLPNRQAKYDPWHLWYDMVCQVFKIQIMIAKYSNLTKVLGSKPHHDFEITTRKYHYYRHWLKVDQYGQAAFNASPFQWGGLSLCTHDWNLFAFSLHISQSGNPHERRRTLYNQYQKARIQSDISEMEKKN